MTSLGKQLTDQLRELAQAEQRPLVNEVTADGATLRFSDYDRYSATLEWLQVGAEMPGDADPRAYLSGRAAAIARRLSFLEEPLAVWELSAGDGAVQLRSSPPLREGDEVSYWEVQLSTGSSPELGHTGARLARYHWLPGMPEREPLAYPATFAMLGRLTDALALALAEPAE